MKRRDVFAFLAAGGVAMAVGCEGSARNERFIDEVGKSATEIKQAFDELERQVSEFDVRDWREALIDVKSAMEELGTKIKDFEGWVNAPRDV
jgi:hypothetical protein